MSKFRNLIFLVLMGFLLLPLIQSAIPIFNIKPLSGAFIRPIDTAFTLKGWVSGKYQQHEEEFLRDSFGFRNLFIRVRNQIDYNLFSKINSSHIVIGKNRDLFPDWYLNSYNGSNFVGSISLKRTIDQLKSLQDTLATMHKTFLVVIAPSKDLFEPENIPDSYKRSDSTNYEVCIKLLKTEGVHFINLNKYFIEQRGKTTYPLYYKYGSHYTFYGACIAGDSIIRMLEKLSNTEIPHTVWRPDITSEEANGDELDLENDMNLLFPFSHDLMGHPQIKKPVDSITKKLSILVVGDSYFQFLKDHYNFGDNFSSFTYAYYYSKIYTKGSDKIIKATDYDLKDALNKTNIIIVEATESNLLQLDYGFAEEAFVALKQDTTNRNSFANRVLRMRKTISKDGEWMKSIAQKAEANNITVDSMLTNDAIYMINHPGN